jgi:hypothetical protein
MSFSIVCLLGVCRYQQRHWRGNCCQGGPGTCLFHHIRLTTRAMAWFIPTAVAAYPSRRHRGGGPHSPVCCGPSRLLICLTNASFATSRPHFSLIDPTPPRHIQHKNIIKFIGCERGERLFRLFMEYVPGGSLTLLVDKFGPLLSAPQFLVDYTSQVPLRA